MNDSQPVPDGFPPAYDVDNVCRICRLPIDDHCFCLSEPGRLVKECPGPLRGCPACDLTRL